MIAEAVDTVLTLGWALAAWILLTAACAVLALYAVAVTVWGAVRVLYALTPHARRQTPTGAPHIPARDSRAVTDAPDAPQRRTAPHAPTWAHTDKDAA